MRCYRFKRELGRRTAFRTAQVSGEYERSALFQQILQGGQRSPDAGIIRDIAGLVHGNVIVNTDKDTFSFEIDITDGFFIHCRIPPQSGYSPFLPI